MRHLAVASLSHEGPQRLERAQITKPRTTRSGPRVPCARGRRRALPGRGWRLSPIIAAAAMAMSSLSVVSNANRLRRFKTRALPAVMAGQGQPATVEASRAEATEPASPEAVGPVTDPVCGMRLDPDKAGPSATYERMAYRFCSTQCRDGFTADPQRYHQTVGH